ncbi:cytochrome c peroxidase [Paucibacter sp. APW11]|uniref:Cytochrome c peroxidase n=1 Tax=Roseateles aquae TaxID=3077235 RepID=A0ABU3PEE9_9BURK|nr:cytochrome c peroxidase [Paucibacter sp. APW11]MDT9000710.1 cytochrome c peroxidase [Paucibacter sp. APW11]
MTIPFTTTAAPASHTPRAQQLALGVLGALLVLLSACGGGRTESTGTQASTAAPDASIAALRPPPPAPPAPAPAPSAVTVASVGDKLFHDRSLSGSGRQACASCHVASQAHSDAPGGFLPLGGVNLDKQGLRSTPSARYLDQAGAFRIDPQGNPHGGLFWDGRANDRVAQARGPLFNSSEMANESVAAYAARLRATPYLAELLRVSNLPASASDEQLLQASLQALAGYQAQSTDFHPFTSKFDAVQDGKASFTAQEARGLAVFNDPQRGNCAVCHSSTPPANAGANGGGAGVRALFTNQRYFALGVPRNQSDATQDPAFFDLGLCGPQRSDLATQTSLCGKFRVPSLRNVALTAPYFHNGRFNTLDEVVAFYATRDLDPARWYPVVNGQVQRYNDLPAPYQANVHRGAPFNRRANQGPAFNAQDSADLVAFLKTLSDGYLVSSNPTQ